ncbi:MAG: hypothetical protein ACREDM_12630 [Methylocella sp.]
MKRSAGARESGQDIAAPAQASRVVRAEGLHPSLSFMYDRKSPNAATALFFGEYGLHSARFIFLEDFDAE